MTYNQIPLDRSPAACRAFRPRVLCRLLPLALVALVPACRSLPAPITHRVGLEPEPDTCGSHAFAHLMGQHPTAAPRVLAGRTHRIASLDAVLTSDHDPSRLTAFFDRKTNEIVGIRCG
jgi:hypothetical protein